MNNFIVSSTAEMPVLQTSTIEVPPPVPRATDQDAPRRFNITPVNQLLTSEMSEPTDIIHGLLHRGSKGVIASASKARKSWILLDLAISISTGTPWMGFPTTQGRVLVVDFELKPYFLRRRIEAIKAEKKIETIDNLDVLSLRGESMDFHELMEQLAEQIRQDYSLIIIDPIYKGLAGLDENRAGDIAALCAVLEALAVQADAAIMYSHHFSKGKQASKDPIDRMSGSGVFARDADAIITLSRHEDSDIYTVDMILRNYPEQLPFVVSWKNYLMRRRDDLDPADIKGKPGPKKKPKEEIAGEQEEILELLEDGPLTHGKWKAKAKNALDVSKRKFDAAIKAFKKNGKAVLVKRKYQLPGTEQDE